MRKWIVSKRDGPPVRRGRQPMRVLGEVDAKHGPDALLKAFERWPDECIPGEPQGGLSARPAERPEGGPDRD